MRRLIASVILAAISLASVSASAQGKRPYALDDPFRFERFGLPRLSPDGQLLVYERHLARSDCIKSHSLTECLHAGKLIVVPTAGGATKPITGTGEVVTDYQAVEWSPDSQRLAFRVWQGQKSAIQVWERQTGRVRLVSDYHTAAADRLIYVRLFRWASATNLVIAIPAQSEQGLDALFPGPDAAVFGLKDRERGIRPSVSTIESGLPAPPEIGANGRLLLVDAKTGRQQQIANGNFWDLQPSPDGSSVACVLGTKKFVPDPNRPMPPSSVVLDPKRVVVVSLRSPYRAIEVPRVDYVGKHDDVSWSPDGEKLALINLPAYESALPTLFVYTPATGDLLEVKLNVIPGPNGFTLRDLVWVQGHRLLAMIRTPGPGYQYGDRYSYGKVAGPRWNSLAADGSLHEISAGVKNTPTTLLPEADGNSVLFVSDGHLWRWRVEENHSTDLTSTLPYQVLGIAPSLSSRNRAAANGTLMLNVKDGAVQRWCMFDVTTGKATGLDKPMQNASMIDFNPVTRAGVASSRSDELESMFLVNVDRRESRELARLNDFVREIAKPETRTIDYTSLDGKPLKAQLVLPYGYEKGRRYPLIVSVYPGTPIETLNPFRISPTQGYPASFLPFAAHGYAVLEPSIPLSPEGVGKADDNYPLLTKGVIPAIDKVVEMGIADPQRVGVTGHSYGGYGVYGLISQTDRFHAAVAWSGASDLISIYGEFSGANRYIPDSGADSFFSAAWAESMQGKMGSPPWRDPQRYIRNSPVLHVDDVHTPILIVHGDQDTVVPVEQSEEFVNAMLRQNKRARFLRYWGEGHEFVSPANIIDVEQQILRWFDEFLMKPEKAEGSNSYRTRHHDERINEIKFLRSRQKARNR